MNNIKNTLPLAFLAICLVSPVHAQFDIVNNIANANSGSEVPLTLAGEIEAQAFLTGPNPVHLYSVQVSLKAIVNPSVGNVDIRTDNAGFPGSVVTSLGNVTSTLNSVQVFTLPASGSVTLSATTKYWIAISYVSGNFGWTITAGSNSTGVGTMLDADRYSNNNGANWGNDFAGEWQKFSVQGYFPSATRYVAVSNATPAYPYTNWAMAAATIQAAIDVAVPGDTIFVSNGVYQTGGRVAPGMSETNRVLIDKPVTVQSVNGAAVTKIRGKSPSGSAAVRCVWMTNGASLIGFTLSEGATGNGFSENLSGPGIGGGVFSSGGLTNAAVINCVISGNRASFGAGAGKVTLRNCLIVSNFSSSVAGGAFASRLDSCTVAHNLAADVAGGVFESVVNNSIVEFNMGYSGTNHSDSVFNYSITSPMPTNGGAGNLANAPVFANAAGGDYRLAAQSPGINAGNNSLVVGASDLDGNPRVAYGNVDMGAYELQAISSNLVVTSAGDGNAGSLRQVVAAVPADGTITFDPSLSGQTITLGSRIFISKNLTIDGSTALDGITLSGGNTNGIFVITNCTVVLDSLTLADAFVNAPQQPNRGGAIYAGNASLTVRNCTIRNNDARYGAAADVYNGTNVFINCTIYQNRSIHTFPSAGAFLTEGNALLHLIHSTVVSNNAFELGGAIRRSDASKLILENSIVALNGEGFYGGPDIWSEGGTNTITIGTNFVGTTSGAAITNFVLTGNPLLGLPQDNGGPTWTMLPATNSPVRNAAAPSGITRDQRGFPRPYGLPDIGAVEALTNIIFYVALNNPAPEWPYITWATAATNIQDAIDVSELGALVLVSNGVYETGGRVAPGLLLTNRVLIDKPVTVQSVNGATVTSIKGARDPLTTNGAAAVRCVWMTNGSFLVGFTLTNGATQTIGTFANDVSGGGVWAQSTNAFVSLCEITGNAAYGDGAGTLRAMLNNCTLKGNIAGFWGGGARFSTLNNCTVVGNKANSGGGVYNSTLENCIVYFNDAPSSSNHVNSTFAFSCTTPMPVSGTGNITNDPMFVSLAAPNLRPSAGSPAREMGNNANAPSGPDLDGNTRIVNGYVDMGAYEYQGSPQGDYDGDGNGNGDERVAGTDFANSNAFLAVSATGSGSVSFDSVTGRVYAIERNDALMATPQVWTEFTNNIAGTGNPIAISDTSEATNRNYRVRVQMAP